jgi:hypothetical protein
MGRKNIINQIEELELDHEEEHFEEHLDVDKKEKKIKNVFVLLDDQSTVEKNEEKTLEQSNDSQKEQVVVNEKPTVKNSRKKNTNQESSS